jgi:plastocyanin
MARLLRRALPVALLLAFLMQATALAATVEVTMADYSFTPSIAKLRMGDTVHWTNDGPSPHTATSNAPLSLWDSGILFDGEDFSFTFTAAGIYDYFCSLHATMLGKVGSKPTASPPRGPVGTVFTVRVASVAAESDFVYDVQIKEPGGAFMDWMIGITTATASFDSTGEATGRYQFRSRLRRVSSGGASGYSPAATIGVTP